MNYDRAFAIVVGQEGGYTNNPNDPGGETNFGICKRDYPDVDIKNLTIDDAKLIYARDYWEPIMGDSLPWPLCLYVFDSAVNQGVKPASMMLQRALDTVQDGIIGPRTAALAASSNAWNWARFMSFRVLRYQSTNNFSTFGVGWITRLFQVTAQGGLQ